MPSSAAPCAPPGRPSRSCPQLRAGPPDAESLRALLAQLPPSTEVLDLYKGQVRQFEAEERELRAQLAASRGLVAQNLHLERTGHVKDDEIGRLQTAVQAMRAALLHERQRSQQLETQNDRLQIQELESRQKVFALLEICGKTDNDITRLLSQAHGREPPAAFIPERIKEYIKLDRKRLSGRQIQRGSDSLRLEVLALENQLLAQERCHLEQVAMLEEDKRNLRLSQDENRRGFEAQFESVAQRVTDLQASQDELTEALGKTRSKYRQNERQWTHDKEVLLRKLQFIQHYGCDRDPEEAGFYTGQRSLFRLGGEPQFRRKIEKLTAELMEHKQLVDGYKSRLLVSEVESENLKEQTQNVKDILKKRTKAMVEQVEVLKERYESLEQRKKKETEGYQADVHRLEQKIKKIEAQLVASAISKSKEHDYIRTIKSYEKELDDLKRSLKKNPQWLN